MEGGDVIYKHRTISSLGTAQVGTAQTLDYHVQLIFELDNGMEDQERSPAPTLTGPTTGG
jgi:hypothetical protein